MKVVTGRMDKWGTCTRVVSFLHKPTALVCRNGLVVVGLDSGDIAVLDAITGSSRSVLSGHVESVTSLAFSQDGTLLVSGSACDDIKLWDIQTGGVVKTFRVFASSVSISPDAITIASGSDWGVDLWDVRSGTRRAVYPTRMLDGVTCLNFLSTIPGRLMFVAGDLVHQWDVGDSETEPETSGHHISFSSDGKRFVLCDEGPPTVRNTDSGTIVATLHSPGQNFSRCCFSPSDEFVAGVADATIYVWNVASTPHLVETFIPHDSGITSLVYSSSLISMHDDGRIRFRRINGDSPGSIAGSIEPTGSRRAEIIYVTLQETEGIAISVDLAGTMESWDLSTGHHKVLLEIPEIKDVGGVRLVNDTLTIVHCDYSYWEVSRWDVKAGTRFERKPLSGDLSTFLRTPSYSCGITKDGLTFFVVDSTWIETWSLSSGQTRTQPVHRLYHDSSPFSANLDGSTFWIGSSAESPALTWDLRRELRVPREDLSSQNSIAKSSPLKISPEARALLSELDPGWTSRNPNLDPSYVPEPDKLHLACLRSRHGMWIGSNQSRILVATPGKEVFRLHGEFERPSRVAWNRRYLGCVYGTGGLLILDFVHAASR